jgi:hypothetical protein
MLTQPQVQRYAIESGLRDIMIAEKEVVLTFLLQLLSEPAFWTGWPSRVAPACGKSSSAARDDFRPIWISRESGSTITRKSSST